MYLELFTNFAVLVPVHEEKIVMHKLLSKHHDVMYKKLSPCALSPAV